MTLETLGLAPGSTQQAPEPAGVAMWQFRNITAPDGQPGEWEELQPSSRIQTMEQRLQEITSFRYNGQPSYEVRALVPIDFADATHALRAGRDAEGIQSLLTRAHRKMQTYVSVYPGDKELRRLLADWEKAIDAARKATGEAS